MVSRGGVETVGVMNDDLKKVLLHLLLLRLLLLLERKHGIDGASGSRSSVKTPGRLLLRNQPSPDSDSHSSAHWVRRPT